jgi:predicted ester cyclase
MSPAANQAIIRRFYEEVIQQRHLAVLDELLAPAFVGFKARGTDQATTGEHFKQLLAFALRCMPECQLTIDQWTLDQDVVVARWSLCGTEVGEDLGFPLVVQQVRASGRDTFRLHDGQIVEHWGELVTLHLGRQLQAIAPLEEGGDTYGDRGLYGWSVTHPLGR